MNKVSLVTLWVDPAEKQILKFEFRFQDLDFLPGHSIVRVESARSTMEMGEPFANVWLPSSIGMRFRLGIGRGAARSEVRGEVPGLSAARDEWEDPMNGLNREGHEGIKDHEECFFKRVSSSSCSSSPSCSSWFRPARRRPRRSRKSASTAITPRRTPTSCGSAAWLLAPTPARRG